MTTYNTVRTYVEGICIKIAQRLEGKLDVYYFKVLITTYDDIHYFKLDYKLKMFIVNHKGINNKNNIVNMAIMEIKFLKNLISPKEKREHREDERRNK